MTACQDEIEIDSFAGGGGASLGLRWALGHDPHAAINHDASDIAMHAANHPRTRHYTEDVWKLRPQSVTCGRPAGLLWASPDCKHFSRAKGGKPVEKRIRSLAWVVIKWAAECQPRIIILENVREFEEWGPLVPRWQCAGCNWKGTEGQTLERTTRGRRRHTCPRCGKRMLKETFEQVPDPARKGLTFRRFVDRLRNLGYQVDWCTLNAADYGAPTHRRRLFLIARNDGRRIVWPLPTHGDPRRTGEPSLFGSLQPWRTAAECIDWSLPCPSIFSRKRPLVEATLRRIAMGIKRYVLDNPRPFLIPINHSCEHFRGQGIESPLPTVTGSCSLAVVEPFVVGVGGRMGQSPCASVASPNNTITAKNDRAVCVPYFGKREGQEPRTRDTTEPFGVLTPAANNGSLVAAFLAKHYGGVVGVPVEGQSYVLVDIGMRMLKPREMARGQGFPDDYVLTGSATSQVEKIGNSVAPIMAKVLVEANYP